MPPDAIPVWETCFEPRQKWVVDKVHRRINMFERSPYLDLKATKTSPKADWPTIQMIILNMLAAKPDDELYNLFINWFAGVFQCKKRPITAWVLHGIEGTGKGRFFNCIARPLLGASNTIEINTVDLRDRFNGWAQNKRLICVDEVDNNDFGEKGLISAKLRNAITEPSVTIRHMGVAAMECPNHACYIFTSNRPQPVFISETDRRYNVGNFQVKKLPEHDVKKIERELTSFAQFLLAHKVDITQANSIVNTTARDEMKKLGRNAAMEVCGYVTEGNFDEIWLQRPREEVILATPIYNETQLVAQQFLKVTRDIAKSIVDGTNDKKLSRDELQVILSYCVGKIPDSPNKFTSFLRHNGITIKLIKRGNTAIRGIEVEWKVSPELRTELEELLCEQKRKLRRVK
jgi:hypothetical protein